MPGAQNACKEGGTHDPVAVPTPEENKNNSGHGTAGCIISLPESNRLPHRITSVYSDFQILLGPA